MSEGNELYWMMPRGEAQLLLNTHTIDFGNIAHKALLKRAISNSLRLNQASKRHGVDTEVLVSVSNDLMHNIVSSLEDADIYDTPSVFQYGEEVLEIVDTWKLAQLPRL